MNTKKNVYLEAMRIVAIIGVLYAHLPGNRLYITRTGVSQYAYLTLTMVSRLCIPIFFMISGGLLLRKQEEYGVVFKKRIVRFIALIVVFITLYYLLGLVKGGVAGQAVSFSAFSLIKGIMENVLVGLESYWYLYAYLGFLLLLPLMQRIAAGMNRTEFYVLLGLHFLFATVIPLVNIGLGAVGVDPVGFAPDLEVPLVTGQAFIYTLLGYYLENRVDINELKGKKLVKLLVAFLVTLLVSNFAVILQGTTTGTYNSANVFMADYLYAIYAYLLIKKLYLVEKPSLSEGRCAKLVCFFGTTSFGVYLLDPFFKLFLYSYFENYILATTPYIVATFAWILFSILAGSLVTVLLKKLPGFKLLL